ncbi:restriction endonuclease subunit S [Robertmurraya yapensis]|uniref:Restriction endonuclease subunit S n=1 Tax=Bacillus yapensis TaxID=2492960 RepID=A0A431VU24_9BACI|nr:restriction endonuclease subunit S [Bacillus yapensis]RTR26717.1 restriction endonuclease subunit S [Bacillus yapensis]TKS93805.1 hypothetical protein FAR12_20645 [Bacillus yapensis]
MTEQINLVPKRRFKEFQNTPDWEQRKLKEIVDLLKDGTHGTHKDGNDAFLLSAKNIKNGQIIIDELIDRKISSEDYNSIFKNYKLVDQDLLITIVGTIGQTALYMDTTSKLAFQRSVAIIRGNQDVNQNFLKSTVDSNYVQKQLKQSASMSAQAGVYLGDLEKLTITIPELSEQIKIGNFFKQLDRYITLHQRKLEKTEALKSAYLSEMFPAEGENEPKRRFAGFTQAWEQRKLGDVIDGLYNGQTPSRFRDDFWNGNINWLSSGELNRSIVKTASEQITEAGQADANLRIVPKNTFVMAITGLEAAGTRGNCGILGIDTTLNQSCMAIFPNKKLLSTQFLFQWYKMVGEDYGIRFTQGTKQQSYNAEIIKDLDICLPKVEEQLKISQFLSEMDNLINLQQRKLEKLQNIKKAYLNEMFV